MSNKPVTSPDAMVKGTFKSDDYKAKLSTALSVIDNHPAGYFNMFVSGSEIWRITSNSPRDIDTEKNPLTDHVHVIYDKVTVKHETSGRKFTNCTAFLDAAEWPLPGGILGINITLAVYNNNNSRLVFEWDGIFLGSIKITREISFEQ